ncbi:MAG TPA: hypothetical protein VMM93_08810 [Vicinamibacterales bacterium]|nr:hypothetical protein [Vicinamibacterales bacterium]
MFRRLTLLTLALALVAVPASAQSAFGLRAGASSGPDQFVFGAHVDTAPLLENLTFRPNLEIGIGDRLTLAALNFEFAYWIPLENSRWRVYMGGGPAANILAFHDDHPARGDTRVEGGLNIMLGLQHDRGLFTELKVGAIDSPDIKFTIGYVLR